jgi:hypothetical protein
MTASRTSITFWCILSLLLENPILMRVQLSQTRSIGWNSWNHFRTAIDDATVRVQAAAMVSSGSQSGKNWRQCFLFL